MSAQNAASTAVPATGRKAWIKKTPTEIVLEQLGKEEAKVAEMRKELAHEERELAKLQQARKVLESQ
jgi:type IV secretory pathway VirB4 component